MKLLNSILVLTAILMNGNVYADWQFGGGTCYDIQSRVLNKCSFSSGESVTLSFSGGGSTCSGPFPEGGIHPENGSHRNTYLDVLLAKKDGVSENIEKSLKFNSSWSNISRGTYCSNWDWSKYTPRLAYKYPECPKTTEHLVIEAELSKITKEFYVYVTDVNGVYGRVGERVSCSVEFDIKRR